MSSFDPLKKFLPEGTFEDVLPHLERNNVALRISRPRLSKLGDYRPPAKQTDRHKISVNGDLNPYSFLITLVHEIAHLYNHKTYGRKVKPHGSEWKSYFRQLLKPFVEKGVFPSDIASALEAYLTNPTASSCTNEQLYLTLDSYSIEKKPALRVSDLSPGQLFSFRGRIFKMERKLRKRYSCMEQATRRKFYFSPLAEIDRVHED